MTFNFHGKQSSDLSDVDPVVEYKEPVLTSPVKRNYIYESMVWGKVMIDLS